MYSGFAMYFVLFLGLYWTLDRGLAYVMDILSCILYLYYGIIILVVGQLVVLTPLTKLV